MLKLRFSQLSREARAQDNTENSEFQNSPETHRTDPDIPETEFLTREANSENRAKGDPEISESQDLRTILRFSGAVLRSKNNPEIPRTSSEI